ncbi:MAG: hypothetical protein WBF38_04590 [Nitrosotalea sp.]
MSNPPKLPFNTFEFVHLEDNQFGNMGRTIEGIVISIDDISVIIETQNGDLTENITIPTQSFYDGRWLVKKPTDYNAFSNSNQKSDTPSATPDYKPLKPTPEQSILINMQTIVELYNEATPQLHKLSTAIQNTPTMSRTPAFIKNSIKKCRKIISLYNQAISLPQDPNLRQVGEYDMLYYHRALATHQLAMLLYQAGQPLQQELESIQEDMDNTINKDKFDSLVELYNQAKDFFQVKSKLQSVGVDVHIAPHLLQPTVIPEPPKKAKLKIIPDPAKQQPSHSSSEPPHPKFDKKT